LTEVGAIEYTAWAPEGEWLALVAQGAEGRLSELNLVSADGQENRALVHLAQGWFRGCPLWSPDGETIVCPTYWPPDSCVQLFAIPVAGGAPRQLTHTEGDKHGACWSPDGRHLHCIHEYEPHSGKGMVVDVGTGEETTLTSYGFCGVSPSPRSGAILWTLGDLRDQVQPPSLILESSDGSRQPLWTGRDSDAGGWEGARGGWTHGGEAVRVRWSRGEGIPLMGYREPRCWVEHWDVEVKTGERRRLPLAPIPEWRGQAHWSPEDDSLVCYREETGPEEAELWIVYDNYASYRRLRDDLHYTEGYPDWRPQP
jgi:hypothetical protein